MTQDETTRFYSLSFAVRSQLLAFVAYVPYYGYPVWWGLLISERHCSLVSFGVCKPPRSSAF